MKGKNILRSISIDYRLSYSSELNHFIDKLLVKLPYDRLSSKEVLESYFPTNVKVFLK